MIQCSNTNFPCNLTKCLWKDIDRDIDETGVINLVFTVKDHGTPSKFNSANVVVNIKGLNDNSPKFALPRKTLYIKEGVAKDNLHTAMVRKFQTGHDMYRSANS